MAVRRACGSPSRRGKVAVLEREAGCGAHAEAGAGGRGTCAGARPVKSAVLCVRGVRAGSGCAGGAEGEPVGAVAEEGGADHGHAACGGSVAAADLHGSPAQARTRAA